MKRAAKKTPLVHVSGYPIIRPHIVRDLRSVARSGIAGRHLKGDSYLKCSCPYCAEVLEYSPEEVGRAVECPRCHEKSQLPLPPPSSAQPDFAEDDASEGAASRRPAPVCATCGTELGLWEMDCPVCEANRRRRRLILTASAALIILAAGGAAYVFTHPKGTAEPTVTLPPPGPLAQPSGPLPQPRVKTPKSTNDFRVSAFSLRKDPDRNTSVAQGDIENNSENTHLNVRIDLDILAADGFKLHTTSAFINELPPHQVWHVLVTTSEPDAAKVEFAGFSEDH